MAALLLGRAWSGSSISFTTVKKKEIIARRQKQPQQQLRCALQVGTTAPGAVEVPQSSTATTSIPQIGSSSHEVLYRRSGNAEGVEVEGKGWRDAEGRLDGRWEAKFRALAVVAADRVEMHAVLAKQRSNWNHLFHQTIVIAAVSAATVAAINAAEPGHGLALLATSLNLVCAAFMALVNSQQPSQLAEEQRRAARFFKRLMKDVESTLEIDPDMREEASAYWKDKVGTFHALDGAFPLPLNPGGLEKFPRRVVPPELRGPRHPDNRSAQEGGEGTVRNGYRFGWTAKTEQYLRENIERMHTADIPTLIQRAEAAKCLNLAAVRVSPLLAVAGALCIVSNSVPALPAFLHLSWLAAAFTVGAVFTHSMSHALQLGGGFEMYRNYAGYYEDVRRAVERMLQLPANRREDGELFRQRINLQLGHHPCKETLKEYDTAGRLF